MGAGGANRWPQPDPALVQRMNEVVSGMAATAEADGYAMAFPRNETVSQRLLALDRLGPDLSWPTPGQIFRENPDYVTSWVAHGACAWDWV